jgi:hypothetical protein
VLIEYRFGSMKAAREDLYHAFHYRAAPFTRAEVSEARVARQQRLSKEHAVALFIANPTVMAFCLDITSGMNRVHAGDSTVMECYPCVVLRNPSIN